MSSWIEKIYDIDGKTLGIYHLDDHFGHHVYGYQIVHERCKSDLGTYRTREEALKEIEWLKKLYDARRSSYLTTWERVREWFQGIFK